jgi:hypothetical protein
LAPGFLPHANMTIEFLHLERITLILCKGYFVTSKDLAILITDRNYTCRHHLLFKPTNIVLVLRFAIILIIKDRHVSFQNSIKTPLAQLSSYIPTYTGRKLAILLCFFRLSFLRNFITSSTNLLYLDTYLF